MASDARRTATAYQAPPTLGRSAPATAAAVAELRGAVVAFARENGVPDLVVRDVALCVSEAVTNAVRHAYPHDGLGLVSVVADLLDGALEVLVADAGTGLRVEHEAPGLGLGLALIVRVTDRCSIDTGTPYGTEVWMRFLLP